MRSEIQRETVEDKRKKIGRLEKDERYYQREGEESSRKNRTQLNGLSAFVLRNTQRQPRL